MYDPSIGRWLQEDPIGFAAGDPNLYRYVGNDPLNNTDPTGEYLVATNQQVADEYAHYIREKYKVPIGTFDLRLGDPRIRTGRVFIYALLRDHPALQARANDLSQRDNGDNGLDANLLRALVDPSIHAEVSAGGIVFTNATEKRLGISPWSFGARDIDTAEYSVIQQAQMSAGNPRAEVVTAGFPGAAERDAVRAFMSGTVSASHLNSTHAVSRWSGGRGQPV
jgi:hypothetical protein